MMMIVDGDINQINVLESRYIDGEYNCPSQRHDPLVQEKNQRLHASLIVSNSGEGEGKPYVHCTCTYLHIYLFTYFSFILAKGAIFVCFVHKYFVKVWNCCLIDFEKCCKRIIESILKLLKASFDP